MIDRLLSFIAPHRCYGCGESTSILCDSCCNDINETDYGRCIWCLGLAGGSDQCQTCIKRLGVTGAWVVGERTGILKLLVGDYKYESIRESAKVMVKLLDHRIALLPKDTIVTTVPTIARHIRRRGFDHAAVLARTFAQQRNLKYASLLRRTNQFSQHELKRAARLKAAKAAFQPKNIPQDVPILLIDDIITTGATLEACIRLLHSGGAREVYVAVIARQLLDETPPPLVK